jgi:hypothetical protein
VKREELEELHYIVPIRNVPSIMEGGILSHRRAMKVAHTSVAMQEVQDRRAKVVVPNGRSLHEYANLYICARNPMMYKRRDQDTLLCVLRITSEVLDVADVVVTDGNAAGDYIRFAAAPGGLKIVDRELTFARNWTHPDPIEYYRRKSAKCAEVLIPDSVKPKYITGAHVSCEEAMTQFNRLGVGLAATITTDLFFR